MFMKHPFSLEKHQVHVFFNGRVGTKLRHGCRKVLHIHKFRGQSIMEAVQEGKFDDIELWAEQGQTLGEEWVKRILAWVV